MNLEKKNLGTEELTRVNGTPMIISYRKGRHSAMSSVADTAGVLEGNKPGMEDISGTLKETSNHCREGRLPERDGLNADEKVFVVDEEGRALLPTTQRRARVLLGNGKAVPFKMWPFAIRLLRSVPDEVGDLVVNIDDGAVNVGIAVVNEVTREVVFGGVIKLRQDVSRKMIQRKEYRRARRGRKLRYRAAKFNNRGHKGWLPPTIRQKKDSVIRAVVDLQLIMPIKLANVEQGMFDTSSLSAGRKLIGKEYQNSEYEGEEFRAKVLWRDGYKCTHCKSKDRLRAHHIVPRSQGGTDRVDNGLTLCAGCHEDLHAGKWKFNKKVKQFKYPSHLQTGKNYLYDELKCKVGEVDICFGWETNKWRKDLGLDKSHVNDAIAMAVYKTTNVYREFKIIPKRKKIWGNNPTKKCVERYGYRHWDVVKVMHKKRGIVIGSISSLKKHEITLRTSFSDDFVVSYKKSRLIYRPNGIVYI